MLKKRKQNIKQKGRNSKKIIIIFLLFGLIIFFWNSQTALCAESGIKPSKAALKSKKDKDISKILLVLDSHVDDPKLLIKATQKLVTMKDDEIQLISSLCSKVEINGTSARSDIAFSLVSLMIILS